ncbi:hypothetical protein CANARDRAFT_29176 [[Candida] arabinofermentans NRRL YB-2248]|uniref:ubiquitinyl hydrolase 1 n=1 Tax=[Candida] arabinofermentans NRRL YB-2248 TaxID=983967 RepID=A0A1E4SXS3_9ASCO|nr:hypothetical protein CANARDRAFT_29176 [[Candida] arabinofermentans NRRL YB-2248]
MERNGGPYTDFVHQLNPRSSTTDTLTTTIAKTIPRSTIKSICSSQFDIIQDAKIRVYSHKLLKHGEGNSELNDSLVLYWLENSNIYLTGLKLLFDNQIFKHSNCHELMIGMFVYNHYILHYIIPALTIDSIEDQGFIQGLQSISNKFTEKKSCQEELLMALQEANSIIRESNFGTGKKRKSLQRSQKINFKNIQDDLYPTTPNGTNDDEELETQEENGLFGVESSDSESNSNSDTPSDVPAGKSHDNNSINYDDEVAENPYEIPSTQEPINSDTQFAIDYMDQDELFELLKEGCKILLVDLRPFDQFLKSHIENMNDVINVDVQILTNVDTFEELMHSLQIGNIDFYSKLSNFHKYKYLIYYSHEPKLNFEELKFHNIMSLELQRLKNSQKYMSDTKILKLDGGFNEWMYLYGNEHIRSFADNSSSKKSSFNCPPPTSPPPPTPQARDYTNSYQNYPKGIEQPHFQTLQPSIDPTSSHQSYRNIEQPQGQFQSLQPSNELSSFAGNRLSALYASNVSSQSLYSNGKKQPLYQQPYQQQYPVVPQPQPQPQQYPVAPLQVKQQPQPQQVRMPLAYVRLFNYGSTCYINSMIQCLFTVSYFRRLITDDKKLSRVLRTENDSLSLELNRIFKEFQYVNGSTTIRPNNLMRLCSKLKPDLNIPNEQQDTSQFFYFIMDRLHNELKIEDTLQNREIYSTQNPETDPFTNLISNEAYIKWHTTLIKNEGVSPITKLFQIQHQMNLRCQRCGYESINYDYSFMLNLNMDGNEHHLSDLIKKNLEKEELSDRLGNAWNCPQCEKYSKELKELNKILQQQQQQHQQQQETNTHKKRTFFKFNKKETTSTSSSPPEQPIQPLEFLTDEEQSKYIHYTELLNIQSKSFKSTTFIKLPQILIIYLSKFSATGSRKLSTPLKYPTSLTFKINRDGVEVVYEYGLSCWIDHLGNSITQGHYTAVVNRDNNWIYCDDDRFHLFDVGVGGNTQTQSQRHGLEIKDGDAYMLFYRQL